MKTAASVPTHAPRLWRSLGDYARDPAQPAGRTDEFAAGAAEWPPALSRRNFVQLLGASLALAGVTGCTRRTLENIVPHGLAPETTAGATGEALSFATAMPGEGYGRGILVTVQGGRPTKIEGNPDHPESLGATDVFTQAAILSLYDPDRSGEPRRDGRASTWAAFEAEWRDTHAGLASRRGAGLAILMEPTTSPTLRRAIGRLLSALPEARWFQHTPLASHGIGGAQPDVDLSAAEVIFLIESDCCYQHPAAVRYGRQLAARRRVTEGRSAAPRVYALEAVPSVTGALADFRLPLAPHRQPAVLNAIAQSLAGASAGDALSAEEKRFVDALVADVRAHADRVVCVAGPACETSVKNWALALNGRHGSSLAKMGSTLRSDDDPRSAGNLAALASAIGHGEIQALVILGCNPAYTGSADLDFTGRLKRVPLVIHLGEYCDETGAVATWHLPEAHFLETWSDVRAYGGGATIQQPLTEPLHGGRSAGEFLRLVTDGTGTSAYELVRETWRSSTNGNFDEPWHRWLVRGVVDSETALPGNAAALPPDFPVLTNKGTPPGLTVIFAPDANVLDGRYANNGWLQELPKPLTHLVWDNAVLISPETAAGLSLANGDVIVVEISGRRLEAPVWLMPGQAAGTLGLTLGNGRTRAGAVGNGLGYDAYAIRSSTAPWQQAGATVRKTGQTRALIATHDHFSMEGRDLVRTISPADAGRPGSTKPDDMSLFPAWRKDRYAWGMSIDLGTCLGCNACIIACQAENNIPVVGKEQVARGREMHWLRVDRYYSGEPANPRFHLQPVPCMQCENAPCEVVCPVAATTHSSEGLNDMVYNRCVGTRYCSNNCPYKVRRFNFLDYRSPPGSTLLLQANPNVTVRERGVMEKCTYCVQRINAGRIAATREGRAVRDGEIRTACQQACPAEAIVFGDLNDPASRVSRRKAEPINYALLEELNTRPRTTYLAAVRHPPLS